MAAESISERIFEAVFTTLDTAKTSGALTYLNRIYQGTPEQIPAGAHPCVILEPLEEDEDDRTASVPLRIAGIFRMGIRCELDEAELKNAITGRDAPTTKRGILRIVRDVKNVIAADRSLGLSGFDVLNLKFPTTLYVAEDYPIRSAEITLEVEAQLLNTGR